MKKPNPESIDHDHPERTDDDFARARQAQEVHPDLVAHSEKRERGTRASRASVIEKGGV
jgi:hypothetical protein